MEVCNCSMFCCTLLYVHSSIAIILMRKRELIALLNLSSWCLVMVERLFLAVPRGCLQFVIVVFPDHTHLLFLRRTIEMFNNKNILVVFAFYLTLDTASSRLKMPEPVTLSPDRVMESCACTYRLKKLNAIIQ